MKKIYAILLLACTIVATTSSAQLPAAYTARLQFVLDSMCNRYHIKGASAAVLVPNAGTWKGVYGESHSGVPITPTMAFPLNSNTKTYIAALLLKMQQDGMLQLSDTIGTWIQNVPNVNGQITIRQLLGQRSGLFNYTDNPALFDSVDNDYSRVWLPQDMLQFVNAPLAQPGATWNYCNTNYLLAGMIIAQETGLTVQQAIRTMLLQPHGLTNTWFYPQETPLATVPHFWFFNGSGITDGVAFGYTPESFYSSANSAGALFSTAEDNVMFWNKLTSGNIINAASLAQWRTVTTLNNQTAYGLGVFRRSNFNGRIVYSHGGTGAGAINENIADSLSGVCISVLTNQDSASNNILLNQVVHALHRVTINPPTAVRELQTNMAVSIYPNPAKQVLHIRRDKSINSSISFFVTDVTGRTVRTGLLSQQEDEVELNGLQNGLYTLKVAGQNGKSVAIAFCIMK